MMLAWQADVRSFFLYAFVIPFIVLPVMSAGVLLLVVRRKSVKVRSLAWAVSLIPSVTWEIGLMLQGNGWRLDSQAAVASVIMLAMVAASYPGFLAWGRFRERAAGTGMAPREPGATARIGWPGRVTLAVGILMVVAAVWLAWR